MRGIILGCFFALPLLFALPAVGFGQPCAGDQFEAASIRLNKDGVGGSIARTPGGLMARNAEFIRLVEMALQTRLIDFSRIPEPLHAARFDIVANSCRKITGDDHWKMLRALLIDRFQLRYHTEIRNVPLYALLVKGGAKDLGPKIHTSADSNCPASPTSRDFCGVQAGLGLMHGQRVRMPRIAQELAVFLDRPVADRTGIPGAFDFQLAWTPDQFRSDDGKPKYLNGEPIDPSGPSLFTAIQEQLGLKLEPGKGPVEFLVIDHAEPPEDN